MSLLQEYSAECTLLSRTTIPDGYGGEVETFVSGADFVAFIGTNGSEVRVSAEKAESVETYTVLTGKNFILSFHDVFKRKADGKLFRVITDGKEVSTPMLSPLNLRMVKAEDWTNG